MMMKKSVWITMGLAAVLCSGAIAQDEKPAAAADKVSTDNSCKNKVSITEINSNSAPGSGNYDYFITLRNNTDKQLQLDVKLGSFPEDKMKMYSSNFKNTKVKAKGTQTMRLGKGTFSNFSLNTVTVSVDKDGGKKPWISLQNCRVK